ncbi:MAG: hypothetical protein HBSAPP03_08460 [Phycisphaerae bacterium]|nr:MAG: hypothetical protein HBSAPP03_08460 [Phycisphaerae bacterium]
MPEHATSTIAPPAGRRAGTWLDPLGFAATPNARGQRVTVLLIATALMSLADLYMTLLFVTNVGMVENNPIARLVMAHNSAALVVVWKLALTVFGVGVLFWFRRARLSEVAAWGVFVAMTCLMVHWNAFAHGAAVIADDYHTLASGTETGWVSIPGD